jgi:ectoine hydroxylase-related dioxygenase (phytanoyl-CoA dioxygenase family)
MRSSIGAIWTILGLCIATTASRIPLSFAAATVTPDEEDPNPDETCDNDNRTVPSSPLSSSNDDDQIERRLLAAERIIAASVQSMVDDSDASTAAALLSDLTLLLKDTMDETEITTIFQEIQSTTKSKNHPQKSKSKSTHESDHDNPINMFSADRHAAAVLDAHQSFDCLEREFDVTDPNFDTDQAAGVLEKCRILVLRNVFSQRIVNQTLARYQKFTHDVRTGRILRDGTTTYGGDYFILKEDRYRLNYMIPRELASADILANEHVLEILSHYNLLDEDFIVNHSGTLNAQPGAPPQAWHADAEYLYGDRSFDEYGVAGQDLPPFAISMFTPLLEMTYDHGPTEFCLGTAHFRGHHLSTLPVTDEDLLENGVVASLHRWDSKLKGTPCPEAFRRTPLLRLGDVVLFDYMLSHRGGPNQSNDLRSMLFTVYSRKWYKDWTFDINNNEDETEFERLTKTTRFAVVQRSDSQ